MSIQDYCETSLDDIVHLSGLLTFEKLTTKHIKRARSMGYIRKKKKVSRLKRKKFRSCCLTELFHSTKRNLSQKKTNNLSLTKQIVAPIVTLKDLISTSFSISSSSSITSEDKHNDLPAPRQSTTKIIEQTPQFSCKSFSFDPSMSLVSTPKLNLVHSYSSISNYRIKSHFVQHQHSLEEQIHNEECQYCTSENALSIKIDSNNNTFEHVSMHSLNLYHAVELYLSSNNSSHDLFDISSIASEQHASINETKQLNLCEINEIIYAIHTDIDDNTERNQILDSLALSLIQVAEETPAILPDETPIEPVVEPVEQQPHGLGQILVRAVMYDIVMKLLNFYLLLLMCYGHI